MDSKKKVTISWSGGKDSAFALYTYLKDHPADIAHLHTVLSNETNRVTMHGVSGELVERQARALGIPLIEGHLASSESGDYEKLIREMYSRFRNEGVTHIIFGDIFLEDLRNYREKLLSESGLVPVYPLWGAKTKDLIHDFVRSGFKTIVCAANQKCYDAGLLGKTIDTAFLQHLPQGTDPCGENGEFHTFLFDGPLFRERVAFQLGGVETRRYEYKSVMATGEEELHSTSFFFQDILPA